MRTICFTSRKEVLWILASLLQRIPPLCCSSCSKRALRCELRPCSESERMVKNDTQAKICFHRIFQYFKRRLDFPITICCSCQQAEVNRLRLVNELGSKLKQRINLSFRLGVALLELSVTIGFRS